MKIKDVYKLKRFGTYLIEIDTDDKKIIREFTANLRRATRFRFIKWLVVPLGSIRLTEIISNKEVTSK